MPCYKPGSSSGCVHHTPTNLCLQLEPAAEWLQQFPLCLPLLSWNLNKLGLLFPAWLLLHSWTTYSILYGFV